MATNPATDKVFQIVELTELILSFLPPQSLIKVVRVCWQWNELTSQASLGSLLFLRSKNLSPRSSTESWSGQACPFSAGLHHIALGLLNRVSVYSGTLSYYPAEAHRWGTRLVINPFLFEYERPRATGLAAYTARPIDADRLRRRWGKKVRHTAALSSQIAQSAVCR